MLLRYFSISLVSHAAVRFTQSMVRKEVDSQKRATNVCKCNFVSYVSACVRWVHREETRGRLVRQSIKIKRNSATTCTTLATWRSRWTHWTYPASVCDVRRLLSGRLNTRSTNSCLSQRSGNYLLYLSVLDVFAASRLILNQYSSNATSYLILNKILNKRIKYSLFMLCHAFHLCVLYNNHLTCLHDRTLWNGLIRKLRHTLGVKCVTVIRILTFIFNFSCRFRKLIL